MHMHMLARCTTYGEGSLGEGLVVYIMCISVFPCCECEFARPFCCEYISSGFATFFVKVFELAASRLVA
jgi:hypothetical protein